MAIERLGPLISFITCWAVITPCGAQQLALSGAAGDKGSSVLSRKVARIDIAATTFLDALVEIGRETDQCEGAVVVERSSVLSSIPAIRATNVSVGDVLSRVVQNVAGFRVREYEGCAVLEPAENAPRYLAVTIPLFQTPRGPLELQSHYLGQALIATTTSAHHNGPWGTISSISAATNSPAIGPFHIKEHTTKELLCILAKGQQHPSMWIAFPKQEGTLDTSPPWRFVRYHDPITVIKHVLREVAEMTS
jgi:hypothetical protein